MAKVEQKHDRTLAVSRGELVTLIVILLVAVVLRGFYLAEIARAPDFEYPVVDSGFSLYWAKGLATGDWTLPPQAAGRDPEIQNTPFQRSPGYPGVLAVLYRLSGGSQMGIRGIQLGVGVVSILLAWLLGRRILGPAVAVTWAALMAVSWPLMYIDAELHGVFLVVLLSLALMLQLHRFAAAPTAVWAAAIAGTIGLSALVRPNILLVVPALLGWGWWVLGRRRARDRFASLLVAAVVAGLIVLSPAVIRNIRLEGQPVLVSSNGGFTAFVGNNPRATGISSSQVADLGVFTSPWQMKDLVARLAAESGREMGFTDASRELGRRARRWMMDNPGTAARLWARKAALFWGPHEIAHNRAIEMDRRKSALLSHLPMPFSLALAGALVGLVVIAVRWRTLGRHGWVRLAEESKPTLVVIVIYVVGWFLSFLPFFITSLYRIPVIPFLLLGWAVAAVHLVDVARRRQLSAVVWLVALLATWLLLRLPIVEVDPGEQKWHYLRGLAWSYQREPGPAAEEFLASIEAEATFAAAHNGLGATLLDAGRLAEAEEHFLIARQLEPKDPSAAFNLGLTQARLGKWSGAAEAFAVVCELAPLNAEASANLGVASEQIALPEAAAAAYERALRLDPKHASATNNLAWLRATSALAQLRNCEQAVTLAESSLGQRNDASLLDTLAAAYAECGRFDEAVTTAGRALELARSAAPGLIEQVKERLELYHQGRAYRAPQ